MYRTRQAAIAVLMILAGIVNAQERVDGLLISDKPEVRSNAVHDYIGLYQRYVSGLKNGRCAMYPSCSNYGLLAFERYPFFKAMTMVSDRLIRCSHEQHLYAKTYEYGIRSCVDYPYSLPVPHAPIGRLYTDSKRWPDAMLQFIDYLINEGDYSSALLEIRRIEFMGNVSAPQLYAKKLLCMRALGMYEEGIFDYETLTDKTLQSDSRVTMQAAMTYYETTNYEQTVRLLDNDCTGDSAATYNRHIVQAIAYAQLGQYTEAEMAFSRAHTPNYDKNLMLLEQLRGQKQKNPTLARYLSIIPGLGYLYSGHKGSALTALLVNGALGYATYTSIKSQNYGVAGLCGLFTMTFYLGNINGAARSAERYNTAQKRNIITQLESINHINLIN